MRVLVVKSSFGNYEKGDTITDPDVIDKVLKSGQGVHVVASEHPHAVAPEKSAPPPAEKSETEAHAE
jgi:hypothetical protein